VKRSGEKKGNKNNQTKKGGNIIKNGNIKKTINLQIYGRKRTLVEYMFNNNNSNQVV
jgi:hypothetical protein